MTSFANRRFFLSAATGMLVATSLAVHAASTDIGRVDVTLSAREDYDSNIFLTSSHKDDYVTTGTANVSFTCDAAIIASEAAVGLTGMMYAQHSQLNTLDPSVSGNLTFTPTDKTTVYGAASYARVTAPNETVNNITTSDNLHFDGNFQNLFSEKLGYRFTGSYRDDNYNTANYADILSYSAGADAVYIYSPKLTMTAGYTHRESWTSNRPNGSDDPASRDEIYSVGFEGELAPKTSGTLQVGGEHRSFRQAGLNGKDGVFILSKIKWVPAPKTSVNIDASEDFDTTATAQSSHTASLTLGLTQTLDKDWSLDGSVGYAHAKYTGGYKGLLDRTDDTYRVKGRIVYAIATNVTVDFSAGYSHTDSTFDVSTYNRVIVGVGLTASF